MISRWVGDPMGAACGVSFLKLSSPGEELMWSRALGCSAVAVVQGFRRLKCTTVRSQGLLSDCNL